MAHGFDNIGRSARHVHHGEPSTEPALRSEFCPDPIDRSNHFAFEIDREPPKVDKAQEWWRGFDAFLDDEINRNTLELIDTPEAIVIRIFNNGLFGSASASDLE